MSFIEQAYWIIDLMKNHKQIELLKCLQYCIWNNRIKKFMLMKCQPRYKKNSNNIYLRLDEHYPGQKEVNLVIWLLCKSEWTNLTNGMSISKATTSEKCLTAELGVGWPIVLQIDMRPTNVPNHDQKGMLATVLQLMHKKSHLWHDLNHY